MSPRRKLRNTPPSLPAPRNQDNFVHQQEDMSKLSVSPPVIGQLSPILCSHWLILTISMTSNLRVWLSTGENEYNYDFDLNRMNSCLRSIRQSAQSLMQLQCGTKTFLPPTQ